MHWLACCNQCFHMLWFFVKLPPPQQKPDSVILWFALRFNSTGRVVAKSVQDWPLKLAFALHLCPVASVGICSLCITCRPERFGSGENRPRSQRNFILQCLASKASHATAQHQLLPTLWSPFNPVFIGRLLILVRLFARGRVKKVTEALKLCRVHISKFCNRPQTPASLQSASLCDSLAKQCKHLLGPVCASSCSKTMGSCSGHLLQLCQNLLTC